MGFVDEFVRGLALGRQQKLQRDEFELQKQRMSAAEQIQRQQLERQGRSDAQADALQKLKLWQTMPQPEQALPTGQAGPPAPMPAPEVEVPSLVPGGAPMRVPPTTMTDILTRNRAQQDLERTNKLEDLRATLGAQKEASSFTITPEQAARSGGMFQPGQTVTPQEASFGAGLLNADEARKARYASEVAEAARRGDAKAVADAQRKFQQSGQLADNYRSETAYKQYAIVAPQYQIVQQAAGDGTGASDLSLIYGYMKILDPGSSVKEGEVANAQNTAGIPEQIRTKYNQIIAGDKLGPEQRKAFASQATSIFGNYRKVKAVIDKSYSDRAKKYGLDPADVIIDFGEPETQGGTAGGVELQTARDLIGKYGG